MLNEWTREPISTYAIGFYGLIQIKNFYSKASNRTLKSLNKNLFISYSEVSFRGLTDCHSSDERNEQFEESLIVLTIR